MRNEVVPSVRPGTCPFARELALSAAECSSVLPAQRASAQQLAYVYIYIYVSSVSAHQCRPFYRFVGLSPPSLSHIVVDVFAVCISSLVLMFRVVVVQEIGGQDPTAPLDGPQEVLMRDHVVKVLKEKGVEMKPIVSVVSTGFFVAVCCGGCCLVCQNISCAGGFVGRVFVYPVVLAFDLM